MIPEAYQNSVKEALQSAFGTPKYDDIRRLTKGLSNALVFRIEVQSKPYLLKIARTDALADPTLYYYACMKAAAEAGIAPRVWYSGMEDKISITDFVETKPFPIAKAKNMLPDVLCKLHSLPPFSKTIHQLDTANRFIQKIQTGKILPENKTNELFSLFEQITSVYPRAIEDMVASHNDLKPENILYDGNNAWLADWEAAFTNDRYSDLSIIANFVVTNEEDETAYLPSYFKREATLYESAKFYLMRQIMHMAYFAVFIAVVAKGKPIDLDHITKYDFHDFHNRMWAGEIDLANDKTKLEYAVVHMEQLLNNMRLEKFNDSLKIVSMAKHTIR